MRVSEKKLCNYVVVYGSIVMEEVKEDGKRKDVRMIKIVACTLVKEGMEEAYMEAARELVQKSAAEEGNITYTLNRDINNPRSFAMIEIWKDQDAIDKHNASEHFTTIVPKLGTMAESKSISLYSEVEYE